MRLFFRALHLLSVAEPGPLHTEGGLLAGKLPDFAGDVVPPPVHHQAVATVDLIPAIQTI